MKYITRPRILLPLVLLVLAVLALPVLASEIEKEFIFDGDELTISNMIGKVDVRSTGGNKIRVSVMVRGDDASENLIEFKTEKGSKAELHIEFPINDHRKYVYPELGRGSETSFSYDDSEKGGSWLKKIFGKDRITVRGKGSGLEVWADVVVEVPKGRSLEVRLGAGEIEAEELEASLVLDTHSGAIRARQITGDLLADTGSGQVTATDIDGNLNVDTGSGKVILEHCKGEKIQVDTGSGGVKAEGLVCKKLNIDTGSGSVRARQVTADEARIDTGSGAVVLQLDSMGEGRFVLDTGSGSIVLDLPEDASARITADTGSGSMNNNLQGAVVKNMGRREMSLEVGGGAARISLDTGSGSITVK